MVLTTSSAAATEDLVHKTGTAATLVILAGDNMTVEKVSPQCVYYVCIIHT